MKHIAINGFGRIGTAIFHTIIKEGGVKIVAINDLMSIDSAISSIKYDSVRGRFAGDIAKKGKNLIVNGEEIQWSSQKDPKAINWWDKNIDVVVESTGIFNTYKTARVHLDNGARRVIVTAPIKDEPPEDIKGKIILMGVNDDELSGQHITSNASCTTNSIGIPIKILNDALGIKKAMLTTVHAYTPSQNLVDGVQKDKTSRKHRAATQNIIPTSTGATTALTKVLTNLENKFGGVALRVPVVLGSIADVVLITKQKTTVEEVNKILKTAAKDRKYKKLLTTTEEPIVSSDVIGLPYVSIIDLSLTQVVDGDMVKIFSWYDNEMGYARSLYEHILSI